MTIPDVGADRLEPVLEACAAAGIPCRLVRSHTEITAHRWSRSRRNEVYRRSRTLWPRARRLIAGSPCCTRGRRRSRKTPTIFTDEIEFTEISRSIAATGRATLRGGSASRRRTSRCYAYLAAPAWWLDDVGSAYTAIKILGVLVMTAAIFPAYALARLVVSRPYALFAAIGTAAAPALAYSPFLVDEPLAYPVSTLALLLIARAGIRPSTTSVGLALAACLVGVLVRTQLAILLPVLGLVLLGRAWRSDPSRRWRATWTAWRLGRGRGAPRRRGRRSLRADRTPLRHLVHWPRAFSSSACSSTESGRSARLRSGSGSSR